MPEPKVGDPVDVFAGPFEDAVLPGDAEGVPELEPGEFDDPSEEVVPSPPPRTNVVEELPPPSGESIGVYAPPGGLPFVSDLLLGACGRKRV